MTKNKNLEKLKSIQGYEECLEHDSFNLKTSKESKFQKFEFLGDRVLSLALSEYLVANYTNDTLYNMSRRMNFLISNKTLSMLFKENNFETLLSHHLDNSINKNFVYADALESIIGFVYLNKGLSFSKKFIYEIWSELLDTLPEKDPKTLLQETCQRLFKKIPIYKRESLYPGIKFKGPAVIEQLDTTTLLHRNHSLEVDHFNNLIIKV